MNTCRSCNAPIRWARTAQGKAMPLNPTPALGGNVDVDADGVAHVVKPEPDVRRYTSHFVNCPQANGHRKARAR
jgi:hypothetical protein